MKTLLKLVLVLAVANLLAVAGFVGWLFASGRVDGERVTRVRDIFRPTIAEEEAARAEAANTAAEADRLAADDLRVRGLPLASGEEIAAEDRFRDRATLALKSLEEQHRRMQDDLRSREEAVTDREEALTVRQEEWEASIADSKDRQTNAQFRKAVRLLEAAPPKQGREWVLELIKSGRADLAVTYLDAMNPAKSANLLKAFKSEGDAMVATDLLERLRKLGLGREASTDTTNGAISAEQSADSARSPVRTAGGNTPAASNGPVSSGPVSNGSVALPRGTRGASTGNSGAQASAPTGDSRER
jgi:hypothetical protein